jgi:uncharacterized protein (DUF697 family)
MSIQEAALAGTGEFEGEYEGEFGEFEGEFGEYEGEYEGEGEGEQFLGDILGSVLGGEYEGEGEVEQFLGDILGSVLGSEMETPLSEAQEFELASELLEITNEQDLEQFLGNIFRSVGGFIKSPVGRALGGVLKKVAKKALPVVGGALGSMVAPGLGTAVGSKLGTMASGMFEVELEAMPAEAAEFEVARRLVNLAASSAHHAAMAQQRPGVSPLTTARAAVAAGARHHAPGVYRVMIRSLVPATAGRFPPSAGVYGGTRRSPMAGRPVYRGAPGWAPPPALAARPGYVAAPGWAPQRATAARPGHFAAPGRAAPRVNPSRPAADRYPIRRGPGYGVGYPAVAFGQRRRPARGAPAYRGRRGYGWGYGDWYTPRYWPEPWIGNGYYYHDADGAPVGSPAAVAPRIAARRPAGAGAHASGRWVRRGRHIVLYGV